MAIFATAIALLAPRISKAIFATAIALLAPRISKAIALLAPRIAILYPSINQKELNFQISAIFDRRWLTTR